MPPFKETGVVLCLALFAAIFCSQLSRAFAEDYRNPEDVSATKPSPPYPAQATHVPQGDVLLQLQVDNGKIVRVTVVRGPSALAGPAAKWVKEQWKFKPGTTGFFNLPVRFHYQPPTAK